jgi:hypothetical protein
LGNVIIFSCDVVKHFAYLLKLFQYVTRGEKWRQLTAVVEIMISVHSLKQIAVKLAAEKKMW